MENPLAVIKVAIVEDNRFMRMAFEEIISKSDGFLVAGVFDSGEEAIKEIPVHQPDVVLMDINLGGMNGIEAITYLKNCCPVTKFMVCTIYEDNDNVFDALAAGANGYILKQTQPQYLLDAIREIMNGGAPMTRQIAAKVVASFSKKEQAKDPLVESISTREHDILDRLVKGMLYKEIALELNISTETVRKHVYHIYKKLHVNNRVEAYNKFHGNISSRN
jgi:DNA-binding NarL/FixJ family response regulator